MQKAMERESGLWVAEKELDEVGQAQCTVCSWSCGNSGRTSNDQDKTDRLAELNTNVQLTTDKYGECAGEEGTDDDHFEEFEVVCSGRKPRGAVTHFSNAVFQPLA